MEPYTILCSTCQSRIRVRNAKLIGQLANCPKCNSMVMITAPSQIHVDSPSGRVVDSTALTKEVAAPDMLGPEADEALDEYRLAPEERVVAPPVQSNSQPSAQDWQPSDAPLLPSEHWTSEGAAKNRQYLMVGFLGVAGIAIATIAFFAFSRWYRATPEIAPPTAVHSGNPTPENEASPDLPIDDASDGAAQPIADPSAIAGNGSPVEGVIPASDGSLDEVAHVEPGDTGASSDASVIDAALTPIPDALAASPLSDGLAGGDGSHIAASSNSMAPQLQNFAQFLTLDYQPTIPDEGVIPTTAPVTAEDLGLSTTLLRAPIPAIDLQAHGRSVLPGLVFKNAEPKLARMLNLWTHISGVPTVIDVDSFAAAGIDRNQTVALPMLQQKSIDEIAQLFATQIGAVAEPRENRYLVFRAPPEAIEGKIPKSISLDGLLEEEQFAWLAESLETLLEIPPSALSVADGQLTCDLKVVDLMTWFSVVRLTESWRAAKGLPFSFQHAHPSQFTTAFVDPATVVQLDHKLTLVSPQSRPVGQVLNQICREAGLTCWIDWAHVGQVGLGPQSTEVVMTHGRPLRNVLANYAQAYSLVVTLLDEESLWITSPAAHRAQVQIYVLPSGGRTPEWWQQQYASLTPANADGIGRVQVVATPGNDFIILRCCRPMLTW